MENKNSLKVFIETYGCTFNQADSQIIAGLLAENNVEIVDNIEDSQVTIINTCYVKNPTENKVSNKIKKLQETYPDKKIVVSGCMVEIDPEKLDKIAPDSSWIGPHKLNRSLDVVNRTLNGEVVRETGFSKDPKVGVSKLRFDPLVHIIQICEGCLGVCTYCCTRFARGSLHSYPTDEIVKEADKAIKEGCVEIQLTAQDTAAFGKDGHEKLSSLIDNVSSLNGNFKVRIGMMHPKNVLYDLDNLINSFQSEKVYKFLHLPVQSGSDKVLKDMRRGHSVEKFKIIVKRFKEKIPNITIATDIIVGYPTESDDDFQKTVDLLNEIKPNLIHISKYKPRKGTTSSNLDEIPNKIMKKRSKYLTDIKTHITEKENNQLLNTIQEVLIVEMGIKSGLIGKTDSYIPVVVENVNLGDFVKVRITKTTGTYLKGEKIE
ncbi:MAG: tRNA (N(6)-L-threonylcarbamoyladenosine(37)-C(2))-methylthiotransferase [Methanobrevibacter sp.]|jgi:MiaB-like tRNA modifying enzyme|nr:tRNA (N(6)-L-threonylcarbamoyladenosine(37)-C(2))-methylthiotransferase [Candidatus Methanovirga aequatorialis]